MSLIVKSSESSLANIIRLSGILEANDYQKISEQLDRDFQRKIKIIILDVTEVKYFSPGGSLVLEKSLKKAEELGIQLFINK